MLTGAVLVYARSISEFGAVVIIAYYPATAPVEIYNLFLQTGLTASASAAVVLLIVTLSTFLVFRTLASGRLLARIEPCLQLTAALPSPGLAARPGSFGIGPIDLHVPADRVLVILGPSGAGKTVLLETVAGLRPRHSGQIRLAGTDLTDLPPDDAGSAWSSRTLPSSRTCPSSRMSPSAPGRLKPPAQTPARCSGSWESRTWPTGHHARSAAASASASPSPVPWSSGPACCCSTSRCPHWTSQPAKTCVPCCKNCWPISKSPPSTSPTTATRRSASAMTSP